MLNTSFCLKNKNVKPSKKNDVLIKKRVYSTLFDCQLYHGFSFSTGHQRLSSNASCQIREAHSDGDNNGGIYTMGKMSFHMTLVFVSGCLGVCTSKPSEK